MKNRNNGNEEIPKDEQKEKLFGLPDDVYDDYSISDVQCGKEKVKAVYFKLDKKIVIESNNYKREIEVAVVSDLLVDDSILHKLLLKL